MSENDGSFLHRTNYLSMPKAQLKIILTLMGLWFFSIFLLFYIIHDKFSSVTSIVSNQKIAPADFVQLLSKIKMEIFFELGGIVGLLTILFVLFGVFLTHNMTGPISKLIQELTAYIDSNGTNPKEISFRASDEFQQLTPLINKIIMGIKNNPKT